MATKISATAIQRGTMPIRGSTSHGAARLISSANESVSAVTSGATSATLSSV